MSVNEVVIPNYTRKQELFNTISHFLGIFIAITVFIISLLKFINQEISLFYFIGLLIFVVSMFLVYLVSGIYHFLNKDNYYKKLFRVIDHCTIYLLIAGTYTPICFVLLESQTVGLVMLIIEWVGCLTGIILNAFFFDKKFARYLAFALYILMGWLVLYIGAFIYLKPLPFAFILGGGIVYSIGAILYGISHKSIGFHCVFHVFVLVSTIIQTAGVLLMF